MMVMPSNNTCWLTHCWALIYGNVGHLYTPNRTEGRTYPHIPYAIDPGTYRYRGVEHDALPPEDWPEDRFYRALDWCAIQAKPPLWVAVPDWVFCADRTFERWIRYAPRVKAYGWPIALVVQDGMTPADVRALDIQPDVIFVGGSTTDNGQAGWKWDSLDSWCAEFDRVHVGRVNGKNQLQRCLEVGAESCDGTGWMRGNLSQRQVLEAFLRQQSGVTKYPLLAESSMTGRKRGPKQEVFF